MKFFIKYFSKFSKIFRGGLSISLIEVLRYLSEFAIIVVLARQLSPTDFGLVALALTFISILDASTDLSIKSAVLQNKFFDNSHLSNAWFLILFRAFFLYLIIIIFANSISNFYENEELFIVLIILGLRPIFQAFVNPFQIYNIKKLEYRNYSITMIFGIFTRLIIIIPLAFILKNFWVLVIGGLISTFTKVIISYYLDRRFLYPKFNFKTSKKLLFFSFWIFISRISMIFSQSIPKLIIPKISDNYILGGFKISEQIGTFVNNVNKKFLSFIALPFLSKEFRDNGSKKELLVSDFISLVILFTIPICLILILEINNLILIILGEKWLFIKEMLIFLIVYGGLLSISSSVFTVIVAYGKPSSETNSRIISLFILIFLIIFDTSIGGILNAIVSSGIILLILSFWNLYLHGLLCFKSLMTNVFLDNIPVIFLFKIYSLIYFNDFNQINSLILFCTTSLITYLIISYVIYKFFNRGLFLYFRKIKSSSL